MSDAKPEVVAAPPIIQPFPALPLEIELLIVAQLRSDRSTLEACSLVCKAWVTVTRPLLFRGVMVDLRRDPDEMGVFLSVVLASPTPHMGRSIRNVVITGEPDEDEEYHLDELRDPQPFVRLSAIAALLSALPQLAELTISHVSIVGDIESIDIQERRPLKLLQLISPLCSSREFAGLMLVMSFFTEVQTFDLHARDYVETESDAPDTVETAFQPMNDISLQMQGTVKIGSLNIPELNELFLPALLTALRSYGALDPSALQLQMSMPLTADPVVEDGGPSLRNTMVAYGAFLGGLGPAIRHLDLDMLFTMPWAVNEFSEHRGVLGLSACTNVESLTLYLDIDLEDGNPLGDAAGFTAFSTYIQLLANGRTFPALRFFCLQTMARTERSPLLGYPWPLLDRALCSLPALEMALIAIKYTGEYFSTDHFRSQLPLLQESGRLLFKCCASVSLRELLGEDDDESTDGEGGEDQGEGDGEDQSEVGEEGGEDQDEPNLEEVE
ncbi:hypothetical protein BD413DRAFT_608548 [Trametes elegans]|nr:hypothetical protein BD413DRAFT_608548 [Trametes elegans]